MKRLHEGCIQMDDSSGAKDATQLPSGEMRVGQMLEDGLAHHGIKGVVAKRQPAPRAHQVGPLILDSVEIDNVRAQEVFRSVAGAKIQYQSILMTIENLTHVAGIGMGDVLLADVQAGKPPPFEKMGDAAPHRSM